MLTMIRSSLPVLVILSLILLPNSKAFQSRLPRSLTSSRKFSTLATVGSFSTPPHEHVIASTAFLFPESTQIEAISSSSLAVAAVTLDPTAFFSDLLVAFLGSPLILAIPIVAALSVVAIMAALIIGYASPAADDD